MVHFTLNVFTLKKHLKEKNKSDIKTINNMNMLFLLSLLISQGFCSKFPPITVVHLDVKKDFHAVGDGYTNDTPVIQKAINLIVDSGGGFLYLPAGTYLLNRTINIPNVPITIAGDGVSVSKLIWQDSNIGFNISQNTDQDAIVIRDLSLHTTGLSNGSAIAISLTGEVSTGNVVQNRANPRINLHNLDIRGIVEENVGWNGCIYLSNGLHSVINQVGCIGARDTNFIPISEFAYKLDGNGSPVEINFNQVWAFFTQHAVSISGNVERVSITQANFVDVNYGILINTTVLQAGFSMSSTQINAYKNCINAVNMNQMDINNNIMYINNPNPGSFLMSIKNSASNVIMGNQFLDISNTNLHTVLHLQNVANTIVSNNVCIANFLHFIDNPNNISNTIEGNKCVV